MIRIILNSFSLAAPFVVSVLTGSLMNLLVDIYVYIIISFKIITKLDI